MFRITQHPSSGSVKLYLTKVADNGSIVQSVVRKVSVWLHIMTYSVCVCVCVLHRVERYCVPLYPVQYTHTHTLQVIICSQTLTIHMSICTIEPFL
jgi:hypothetical protein